MRRLTDLGFLQNICSRYSILLQRKGRLSKEEKRPFYKENYEEES